MQRRPTQRSYALLLRLSLELSPTHTNLCVNQNKAILSKEGDLISTRLPGWMSLDSTQSEQICVDRALVFPLLEISRILALP